MAGFYALLPVEFVADRDTPRFVMYIAHGTNKLLISRLQTSDMVRGALECGCAEELNIISDFSTKMHKFER